MMTYVGKDPKQPRSAPRAPRIDAEGWRDDTSAVSLGCCMLDACSWGCFGELLSWGCSLLPCGVLLGLLTAVLLIIGCAR